MPRNLLPLVPALVLGALGTDAALAAQNSPDASTTEAGTTQSSVDPTAPDQIIVTGTRIHTTLRDAPAAVTIVGKDDIQLARPQMTLMESLRGVPGLFMQDPYNMALGLRVSIRGFGARANYGVRGVKILVNGIPTTAPDGSANANTIDLGSVGRIEVIRGPSATQYGNATGGIINITTQPPPAIPFVQARISGGSYGFKKIQAKTGAQGKRVGYVISVSDRKYDGYREHAYSERKQITSRFDINLGKDRLLRANFSYGKQPITKDPGGVTAAFAKAHPRAARPANVRFDARQRADQTRLGFVYNTPIGENGSLTARNYYSWRDYRQFLPYHDGGVPSFDRFFTGGGVTYDYNGFWLDRPNKLVVGIDLQSQTDDRQRHNNHFGSLGAETVDQTGHVTTRGIFVQDQLSITKSLLLTLGARYDEMTFDVDDHFLSDGDDSGHVSQSNTSPMAALVYTLSPAINFYTKYSTAFEWPTTGEFAKPNGSGGFNQSLKPQLSTNYEFGMRGTIAQRHHYEMAIYTVETDGELIPFEVPGSPGHDYFVNAGESHRNGVELSFVSNLTNRIRTTFSYTHSDFKFDKFVDANGNHYAGNTIPGAPENQFYAEIRYEDPHGWFGSFDVSYIGEQYASNANDFAVPSYTLANLRAGYHLDSGAFDITPYVSVNNVFDEFYNANVRINAYGGRYYEAGPDRNYFAGVSVRYRY